MLGGLGLEGLNGAPKDSHYDHTVAKMGKGDLNWKRCPCRVILTVQWDPELSNKQP